MSADDAIDFTDAEWRKYQSIPEQGYSHRHWLNHRNREAVARLLAEARAEAWLEGWATGQCDYQMDADNPYRAEDAA